MMSAPLKVFLALLRIAAGVSLVLAGVGKLSWFGSAQPLQATFTEWIAKAPTPVIGKYLAFLQPHATALARVVVLGELGLGGLLIVGFLTPIAAVLAFLMVLQFHFASGVWLGKQYVTPGGGLVYLLVFLVLFAGRAGQALGLDGFIGRAVTGGGGPARK